jgi:two-component system C4-dicarboxylate transport response regulator DctD
METRLRIVLIDDNCAWLEVLSEYLRARGFQVLTAVNALQGLCLLDSQDVSLVVCDYNMPGINGLQLLRVLQARQRQVAVLMMSNHEERFVGKKALAAGAQAFLEKTASPSLLLRIVRQLLETSMAQNSSNVLKLWQRLLPGPKKAGRRQSNERTAPRSPNAQTTKAIKGSP